MEKRRGKKASVRPGGVLVIWFASAGMLLLFFAALAARLRWSQEQLTIAGSAALFAATAATAFARGKGNGQASPARTALGALALVGVLLLTGFLIDAQAMSLAGLFRVLISTLAGGLLGMKLGTLGGRKRSARTVEIKKRRSARAS